MSARPPWRATTRPARGAPGLRRESDPEVLSSWLQDAARYPGGHTGEVCFPEGEADVAALVREGRPLLVVGAQSSLTGGATPRGEVVVSTSRLLRVGDWTAASVTCGAGVTLHDLEEACAARDVWFPPVPTWDGATVGGVVSTDAAGAATFRHGTVRAWVDGLVVVLAGGEVLDLSRGEVAAHDEGYFEIEDSRGALVRVPVPRVASPAVPKVSAGYRGGRGMDLVDLFVGSEGTLGFVVEARLRLASPRPARFTVLVPVAGDDEAVELTRELRGLRGQGLAAIEYMDARCLDVLREDGVPARVGVALPASARAALLVQAELPPAWDRTRALAELESIHAAADGPVAAVCRVLEARGLLGAAVPALPGEDDRRRALFALREAVPQGVNARVRDAALASGDPVSKSGGDVIVPFERLAASMARWRAVLDATGLEAAVWGHVSDGNLHPNLVARDARTMEVARLAQLEIGRIAIEEGGSPLAEHGTGRNPTKKTLLAMLHGEDGVASMRATKRALDPGGLFAPGVLFDAD